ncbi:aminotransferase class I/II-fold pyridoxal phosphate-dependent enzyme [Sporosarcina highlanderae]|uniref:Aminotransferase class I/II-fold pyridoxal phosphate-dependent enzyme n=1 Tax=Sporosarcina highlanderae TaxID=3035916 RepID=A0ABT8JUR7_9BACL|nr:aminotransferase class I/II-fold pyridoxal phosphate-dependent enzyme [Sporosarcina highlanderae]MDN4608880.1 aminotransferase class I/II-fold pyridoxal phosphate-dependent enzyme [Sporosarcina highlanderae]
MNQNNRPLVQALHSFKEQAPASFHVPGHKHGLLSSLPDGMRQALSYDYTELTGLDDLHEAEGIIKEAESLLTALYKSSRSFFLVNGSTVGNLAMIYSACGKGDTVIVQRNAHKSVFHAIELTGAHPVLISPPWDTHTRTPGVLTAEQVDEALAMNPEAKAVVLTYPTYYGVVGKGLREIIELCHSHSVPVLVDEAHGAHFIVGEPFPRSAIEQGADVVVHSAHKTLPAMTMGSFLHVQSELISEKKIAHYLQMLQTSSPSYLIMASLDDARAYAASCKESDKQRFMELRSSFIQELKEINCLKVIETDDPLKLLIRAEGQSGFALQAAFESKGIYTELADPYQVLLILPLWNEQSNPPLKDWKEKMIAVVNNLGKVEDNLILPDMAAWPDGISMLVYPPSSIVDMETEWIAMDEATGRVAAESLIPYPPGIPLLIKGERIMESHVTALSTLIKAGARFQGAIRPEEKVLYVLK